MRTGDFLRDGRKGFIDFAVVLKFTLTKHGNMIFSTIPFPDKLLAMIKCIFVEGLLNLALNQPFQLILRPDRHAAIFLFLQKIRDLANDNIIALWSPPPFENCYPKRLQLSSIKAF